MQNKYPPMPLPLPGHVIKDVPLEELPDPKGYSILVAVPMKQEKTEGGVFIPDDHRDREDTSAILGLVLKVGERAYKGNDDKFGKEDWCEPGSFVMFRSFSGTHIEIHGQKYRLIADDAVEAVTTRPDLVVRA